MTYFTSAEEVQLSQEVVATTLAAALHEHGAQKAFAARAGITPVYLNNIIKQKQMPRVKMARHLAELLPLSPPDRTAWVEQVERHWYANRHTLQTASTFTHEEFEAVVREAITCRLATFDRDPKLVQKNWWKVLILGNAPITQRLDESTSLHYAELCDPVHEGYTFAGRHVDALWVAKRKQVAVAMAENNNLLATCCWAGPLLKSALIRVTLMRQKQYCDAIRPL